MLKNKKILSLLIILLLATTGVIVYYIFSNKIEVDKDGGVTTKKDVIVNQEVSYEKDGNLFKFVKNRLNRTVGIEVNYNIDDKAEFTDFLGQKMTMAPFLINMLCGLFNQGSFDPESLKEASKSADTEKSKNLTEDDQFKNALDGYKVADFKIEFKDKESGDDIAACQSNQKGFENIKFTTTRDYSGYGSFLGSKIGILEEKK